MHLVPMISWNLKANPAETLDPRLIPLLKAIAASGSLAAAVLECRISYRAGWGLLRDYREKLSGPLVVFQRGRGGRLTAAGKQLLHVHADATQKLDRVLSELSVDIGPDRAVMDEP